MGCYRSQARRSPTNADSADLASWLDDMFLPPDVLEWPLNVAVVRSGDRTILIDAGLGAEFPDFPTAGRLALRLEAAGVDAAAVTDVVLTHMHMDHIGGLLGDGLGSRLRPDLRVHVAAAEAEFWESPDFSHTDMPAAGAGRASVGRHAVPGRVPQPAAAVRDGVRGGAGGAVCRTGGHTPGHSVVRLASGGDAADVRRRRRVPGRVR